MKEGQTTIFFFIAKIHLHNKNKNEQGENN